ncbi:MAG: 23S rRNA (guanosine(2251)-2'-O)-methyltransferase RlmB [Mycoplasmatota bacterium]|nr:23S rRNA (guanosine(2251)-2'-O)-methyltransferase RlmB [Mycoplasmatota bacterium]
MLVYGRNVAREILRKRKKIEKIILQEGFDDKEINSLIEKGNFKVIIKPKRDIDRLADGVHQGIILYIPDYKYKNLNEVLENEPRFIVLLDHLEDPHNLGAIIRTCEAAGVDAIIMPKDRQVMINSTVMKTSVGTLDNMNIVAVTNLVQTMKELKNNGFWLVGTALNNSVDYRSINYSGKIGLVIGNEGSGMSRLVGKECDFIAKIPMYGTTNSLNASVAAGIMIYEVIRNRK